MMLDYHYQQRSMHRFYAIWCCRDDWQTDWTAQDFLLQTMDAPDSMPKGSTVSLITESGNRFCTDLTAPRDGWEPKP
jgi:hypothetical protein